MLELKAPVLEDVSMILREKGTYYIGKQRRLRWACASLRSRMSLHFYLTQNRELEEAVKEPHLWLFWVAVHACSKDHLLNNNEIRFLVRQLMCLPVAVVTVSPHSISFSVSEPSFPLLFLIQILWCSFKYKWIHAFVILPSDVKKKSSNSIQQYVNIWHLSLK